MIVSVLCARPQVRTQPWWEAQYFIPMLGMLLGNCISSISVGLSALLEEYTTGAPLPQGFHACLHQGFPYSVLKGCIPCASRSGLPFPSWCPFFSFLGRIETPASLGPCCRRIPGAGRDKIELLLSLGATRWEASRETVSRCVRLALTPILNQMNVVVRAVQLMHVVLLC